MKRLWWKILMFYLFLYFNEYASTTDNPYDTIAKKDSSKK